MTTMQQAIEHHRAKREAERQSNWDLLEHRVWLNSITGEPEDDDEAELSDIVGQLTARDGRNGGLHND